MLLCRGRSLRGHVDEANLQSIRDGIEESPILKRKCGDFNGWEHIFAFSCRSAANETAFQKIPLAHKVARTPTPTKISKTHLENLSRNRTLTTTRLSQNQGKMRFFFRSRDGHGRHEPLLLSRHDGATRHAAQSHHVLLAAMGTQSALHYRLHRSSAESIFSVRWYVWSSAYL